jgi:benzoate membrane transport protein
LLTRLTGPEPASEVGSNLRDLPRYTTISTLSAGFIATLLSIAGPALLVYQAAVNAEYSAAAINSWFFAIFVGGGLLSLLLAILYREPICGAYSIAGSALLVPVLAQYSLPEAVGAFLISGLLITLVGISGLFGWIMDRIPNEVIMGMLAGILLKFGIAIFTPLPGQPVLVSTMILIYVVSYGFVHRLPPVLLALLGGTVIAALSNQFDLDSVRLSLSQPVLVSPEFRFDTLFSLSLPLTLLALASQNAPGVGILRANGYRAPANAITLFSGIGSILTAPLLGHGVSIAAPMTAICASPEAHSNLRGRYVAAVIQGFGFIAFGIGGATAISLIQAFPTALVTVVAGMALLPAILQALRLSVGQSKHALSAAFALLIGASEINILGINSAFWAIVGGVVVAQFLKKEPTAD